MTIPRLVATSLVGVLAVGCSSSTDAAPTTTIASGATAATLPKVEATSPPAASAPDETQAVLQAYAEFHAARHDLFANPVRDSPTLQRYMTGEYREVARAQLDDELQRGFVSRFPQQSIARYTARVTALQSSSASLLVCVVDDGYLFFPKDGHHENEGTATFLVSVTMTKEDGIWKVAKHDTMQQTSGIGSCALQ